MLACVIRFCLDWLQCRVYPFFPRILKTPEAWNGEVVDAPNATPTAGANAGCALPNETHPNTLL